MSQSQPIDPPKDDDLDALSLSALLSSRVCHDLINPVGAIGSGLEVLDDPSMDGSMREAAQDLIRSGAAKAIALLTYARLAAMGRKSVLKTPRKCSLEYMTP